MPTAPIQPVLDQSGGDVQVPPKSAMISEPSVALAVVVPQITPVQPALSPDLAASKPLVAASAGQIAPSASTGMAVGKGLVVFKSRATAWVEVVDAAKVVQLRKTLMAGESIDVSGALPLSVIVGKADSTEVLVRGKAFDLTPLVKDNVARFEVR